MRIDRFSKILVLSGLCFFLSSGLFTAMAQDVIRASGGTDISIDNVASGTYSSLSGPTIRETAVGQLKANSTIVLTLPPGFEWNEAANITITIEPVGTKNTDLEVVFSSITKTSATFTVTVESRLSGQGRGPGRVTIGGLQLRPTNTTVPNMGQISNTGTTGPDENYGDLSTKVGAISVVRVETKADGSGIVVPEQNLRAADNLTVYSIARDVGNNFIENIALDDESNWSLINTSGDIISTALTVSTDRKNATLNSQRTGTTQIQAFRDGVNLVPSGTITVTPRPASEMQILTQPSTTAVAGDVFGTQPVLHLFDQFGNLVTTDNSTEITASINSGQGDLFGTKVVTASAGEIIFTNLSAQVANDITLEFSNPNLENRTSNTITVSPANESKLSYNHVPSSGNKGVNLDPPVRVQLLDAFDNQVPLSGVGINIAIESGTGLLEGSTSLNTNADGEAIFDNIRFDTEGDKTIKASSTGLTSAISETIVIFGENDVSTFLINDSAGNPIGTQTAGVEFDINIKAVNANGDVVQDYTGLVEITSSSTILTGGGTVAISNGLLENQTLSLAASGDHTITATDASQPAISGSSSLFTILPNLFAPDKSTITATPEQITADGTSSSQITVQLQDEFENNLITGGETITIETTAGSLGDNPENGDTTITATDNNDGTYSTTLTSSTSIETATITALESGAQIATTDVPFTAGNIQEFVISIPTENGGPATQTAGDEFLVTAEAVDQNGNRVTSYSGELTFSTNSVISSGQTAQVTNGFIEDHPITLTKSGSSITLYVEDLDLFDVDGISDPFQVVAGAPSPTTSNVLANPTVIQNDGLSTSTISVILRDQFSNRVLTNLIDNLSLSVEQIEENGNPSSGNRDELLGDLTFNSMNSSYQATLTSTTTSEKVEITATFSGNALNQQALVSIVVPKVWDPGGGPSATNWNDDGNWEPQGVPDETDFVVIPGGLNNYPDLDINPTIGSLEIQDGGQLVLFGGNAFKIIGSVIIDGSFDTEDNTTLEIGGNFSGTGTFVSGSNATILVGGDISIENLLAGTEGTILRINGNTQQKLSSVNFLINRLEILNDFLVTSGDVIDTSEIIIADGVVFELQQDAGITLDNFQNLSGAGSLILNNNTLVVMKDLNVLNIDTSLGTVVFGIRVGESFDGLDLQQQQISNLSQMKTAIINNTAGVRTFDDAIISDQGSLTLENGELIIGSGRNFIANNITYNNGFLTFRRSISQRGWRLLSTSVTTTFGEWFNGLTLQGMTGSTYPDRQPNLLFYNETFAGTDNQRWRTPGDVSENLTPGRGYFFYVFGDVAGDADYNDTLPQTLTVSGQEHATVDNSPFDLNVTYTAEADTGFNIVGNPFGATINWDDPSWVKENMDNVLYIWDEATNQYKTWNGVSGSHESGNIAPFQGFWVKANNANTEIEPSLQVSSEAKTTGGVFRKSRNATVDHEWPIIEMQVEGADMQHSTHFTFTEKGRNNIDNMDAYRLLPFGTNSYLEIFTLMDDGTELAITNLPRKFGKPITLPLHVSGVKDGSFIDNTISLSWPQLVNIPEGWTITLIDNDTNKRVDLLEENFYDFTLNERAKSPPVMNTASNFQLVQKSMAKKQSARFTIEIDPGADAEGVPEEVELDQNFSNPFSQTTTIRFGIPREQRAKIEVYDVLGRLVQTITDQRYDADYHQIEFNGRSLASGVYIYRLITEEKTIVKKMTLIK